MKRLRIACTIISALFLVALLPVTAIFGFTWAGVCIVGAGIFYLLMTYFKSKQEENEQKDESSDEKKE